MKYIIIEQPFTKGKQNKLILLSLLCILETICQKRANFLVNSVESHHWKSSVTNIALHCLNWTPVATLIRKAKRIPF